MLALFITAVVAFSLGFIAAALLRGIRSADEARSAGLLIQTVETFTRDYADRSRDVGGRVSIAREELDDLDRALELRDELLSV